MRFPLISLTLLGLLVGSAQAEETENTKTERAKALFQAGSRAFRAGNYPVAVTAMEAANELAPRPEIAFSLAQACRLQFLADGDATKLERSVELFEAYLEQRPDGNRRTHASQHLATLRPILERIRRERPERLQATAPESERAQLLLSSTVDEAVANVDGQEIGDLPEAIEVEPGTHRIEFSAPGYAPQTFESLAIGGKVVPVTAALEPLPALISVQAPDGAEISVDGVVRGRAPVPRALEVPEGPHTVLITERGSYPFRRELSLEKGAEVSLSADLGVTNQRIVAWAMFGVGGALLATSGFTAIKAMGKQGDAQEIEDRLATSSLTPADVGQHEDLKTARNTLKTASIFLLGGAITAGAIGGLLFFLDDPGTGETAAVVTPAVSESSVGAAVAGRF